MSLEIENIENFLDYKDCPATFFIKLLELWHKDTKNQDKQLLRITIELNKSHKIDFCKLACLAIDEGFRRWDIVQILKDSIPFLNLTIDTMILLLRKLCNVPNGNIGAKIPGTSIESLVDKQPQFSRELLASLLKLNEPFIVHYIPVIYERFSKEAINKVHEELIALTSLQNEYVIQSAVIALGKLQYNLNEDRTPFQLTIKAFDDLLEKHGTNISSIVTYSLGELFEFSNETRPRLSKLSQEDDPKINHQISVFLYDHADEISSDKWFQEILMTLTSVKCQYQATIENIDQILHKQLVADNSWGIVEQFFTTWLLSGDYFQNESSLESLFHFTLNAFFERVENLYGLLTRFLNSDNPDLHKAASELIDYGTRYLKMLFRLDKKTIQQLEFHDIQFICSKILGYVYDEKTLCSLIFSVLEARPHDTKAIDLTFSIFYKYLGQDYPEIVLDFLRQKMADTTEDELDKSSLEKWIYDIEADKNTFDSLPYLNELSAPTQFSYQVELENRKKMKHAIEEAEKGSFVNLIFPRVSLKYGKGHFCYQTDHYSETSNLEPTSASVPIPKSLRFCPVSASMRRARFRMISRLEVKNEVNY